MHSSVSIAGLRDRLATLSPAPLSRPHGRPWSTRALDQRLGAGLLRNVLHEVYAASGRQAPIADGLGLALALGWAERPLVWIRETRGQHETGGLYGGGLSEWGATPEDLLLVHAPDAARLLAAGEETLRSGAAGVVLMSAWGEAKAFSLTASRRLAMAAQQGRTTAILIRANARPQPSAAETRWSVEAAPSRALEARAPGRPAFKVSLLRSRAGLTTGEWIMEWDRETRSFVEPEASGRLVSVSARRPAGVRAA